jgi:hypothetical protein
MDNTPNRLQEQAGEVADRKSTMPEGQGPLQEGITAATQHPLHAPEMPTGSEVDSGWRRRDSVWPEVHDPFDTDSAVVDPRSSGDPIGENKG